jgi:hypothetical protein
MATIHATDPVTTVTELERIFDDHGTAVVYGVVDRLC